MISSKINTIFDNDNDPGLVLTTMTVLQNKDLPGGINSTNHDGTEFLNDSLSYIPTDPDELIVSAHLSPQVSLSQYPKVCSHHVTEQTLDAKLYWKSAYIKKFLVYQATNKSDKESRRFECVER